jgi:hypothetical protein
MLRRMELPPPSDAQLANLIASQKKRRTTMILLFAGIGATLVTAIGVSSVVFGKQARKKGDIAYSRATKCLVGKPLAAGEDPMLRYRAAWRGRVLDTTGPGSDVAKAGRAPSALRNMEASEEAKAKMWPNRCVGELVSLTDTLKEIGEMTEGKKDLGAASRALAKATAGDNWKNTESYEPALTDFLDEGRKAKFNFVDQDDIVPPVLVEAKSFDDLTDPKGFTEGFQLSTIFAPGELLAFVAAGSKGAARICRATEAGPIDCGPASASGLPPEASGFPTIFDHEDGAPVLLVFGRPQRFLNGDVLSSGLFRSGDGFRIVPSNTAHVVAGWSPKSGPQTALLRDGKDARDLKTPAKANLFKLVTADGDKIHSEDVDLADWSGDPRGLGVIESRVYWATGDNEIRMHGPNAPKKGQPLFKLPGGVDWMHACTVGTSHVLVIRTVAGGLARTIVSFDDQTNPGVVGGGTVSCGADAVHVLSGDTVAVCKASGCQPETISDLQGIGRARVGDSAIVVGELTDGILLVRVVKGDKVLSETIYDGRIVGGKIVPTSEIHDIRPVPTRHGAVLAVNAGSTSFLGITEAGVVTRLATTP